MTELRLRAVLSRLALAVAVSSMCVTPAPAQLDARITAARCGATLDEVSPVVGKPLVYALAVRITVPAISTVRVLINTVEHSYAVVLENPIPLRPANLLRYVALGDRSRVESAWVDRAGAASDMKGCLRPPGSADGPGQPREPLAPNASESPAPASDVTLIPAAERCFEPAATARPIVINPPSITKGDKGAVDIRIDLDAQDRQTATTVYHSSGDPTFDARAVAALRRSMFVTQTENCRPKAGSFLYTVDASR